jgi:hypothetical protein
MRDCAKSGSSPSIPEACVCNAIHYTLVRRYGAGWYSNHRLIDVLPDRYKEEVRAITLAEQDARMAAFTGARVVAADEVRLLGSFAHAEP